MKILSPRKMSWKKPMAPRPRSMTNWRDMLLPAVFATIRQYPDLSSDIYIDFAKDCLCIIVLNDKTRVKHEDGLLTRHEMESNTQWSTIVQLRLQHAIEEILPRIIDASEYEDVMACQEAMDDLAT